MSFHKHIKCFVSLCFTKLVNLKYSSVQQADMNTGRDCTNQTFNTTATPSLRYSFLFSILIIDLYVIFSKQCEHLKK